jgi:hypothetical protein
VTGCGAAATGDDGPARTRTKPMSTGLLIYGIARVVGGALGELAVPVQGRGPSRARDPTRVGSLHFGHACHGNKPHWSLRGRRGRRAIKHGTTVPEKAP